MKYLKRPETGEVFAFEADGSQDSFIPGDLVEMSAAEIKAHVEPPLPDPVALRREEIAAELAAVDLASVRPLRAVLAAEKPDPEDVAKLAELDAQASALRAELAGLSDAEVGEEAEAVEAPVA